MVLEDSETVASKIAWTFFTNKHFSAFIESAYCRAIISRLNLHENIAKSYPPFGKFFTPEDTALMVQTVLARLVVLDQVQVVSRKITDPEERAYLLSMKFLKLLPPLLDSLQVGLKNETDLKRWLSLRDRWYFFLEYIILERVKSLEILKKVESPESYLEVYSHTVRYYLEEAFEAVTSYLEARATTFKIAFKPSYRRVGGFFRPPEGMEAAHL
ncbi:MAG: hypothetical protein KGI38_00490 [Thaumarchaeota archaeon]|nr:hypothetical protein [Nitrososphaerota archaeon]